MDSKLPKRYLKGVDPKQRKKELMERKKILQITKLCPTKNQMKKKD